MKNLAVVLHDDKVVELTGGKVAGESPAAGGDEDWGFAREPIHGWIGRDERGEDGPLFVGEVGGKGGVRGRKGRISRT